MRSKANGFTLIELLVTMTILALVASIAFVAGGDNPKRQLRSQLDQLRGQIELAGEEAQARNLTLALALVQYNTEQLQSQWLYLDYGANNQLDSRNQNSVGNTTAAKQTTWADLSELSASGNNAVNNSVINSNNSSINYSEPPASDLLSNTLLLSGLSFDNKQTLNFQTNTPSDQASQPVVVFFSSGQSSGATLLFSYEQQKYQLRVNSLGRSEIIDLSQNQAPVPHVPAP